MRKVGLVWKKGISFLVVMSFLLLATSSFIACSSRNDAPVAPAFSAATQTDMQAAVDTVLATATYKRGISVAVYKDGYQMWTYAAGFADGYTAMSIDAPTGTAMTTGTPTFAYSITKTFISALVLKQIETGLYSLDDTVADLLSTHADYASLNKTNINVNATVAHLLKHTSGMPDYALTGLAGEIAMCNPFYTTWKPADILNNLVTVAFDNDQWLARTFEYSNTNYVLLGMIAQQMDPTNRTLNTLLAANFFTPLGISALLAPQDVFPPATIAHPYDDSALLGGAGFLDFSLALPVFYPTFDIYLGIGRGTWAAGGIITTAPELAKWGHALYDPAGSAITATVRTRLKDSAPSNNDYGYGINYNDFVYTDFTVGGTYGHGGSAPGYKTTLRYEINQRITVAIITNVNHIDGGGSGLIDQNALTAALFNAYKENN